MQTMLRRMKQPRKPQRRQHTRTFVREWRKRAKMTIEDLAERVGVEASAISYLERGLSGYVQPTMEKISEVLEVPVHTLISRPPSSDEYLEFWESASDAEREQAVRVIKALRP